KNGFNAQDESVLRPGAYASSGEQGADENDQGECRGYPGDAEGGTPRGLFWPAVPKPPDVVAGRDRLLELAGHLGGIPQPPRRPLQGRSLVEELGQFLLEDAADVGQQLFAHLPLAGGAGPNGSDGSLDDDLKLGQREFVHAGAPRMPPRTRTNCRHST